MNELARYILVFLLGWAGAVYSYSDLIYSKKSTPVGGEDVSTKKELKLPPTARGRFIPKSKGKTLAKETEKPQSLSEDVSTKKELKLPPTARGRFITKSKKDAEPKP